MIKTPRKLDLTGRSFGRLTVIDLHGLSPSGRILWECLCDCGGRALVQASYLLRGHTRSCGCLKADALRDLGRRRQTPVDVGSRHGLLTVTGEAGRDHAGRLLVRAVCDCGTHTVARWNNLFTGVTRSCGCLKRAGGRRAPLVPAAPQPVTTDRYHAPHPDPGRRG